LQRDVVQLLQRRLVESVVKVGPNHAGSFPPRKVFWREDDLSSLNRQPMRTKLLDLEAAFAANNEAALPQDVSFARTAA
jgi:hypothetical protein